MIDSIPAVTRQIVTSLNSAGSNDRAMTLRTGSLLAAALLLCASCASFTSERQNRIVGSWRWVYSVGGFVGHKISPAMEGYSERRLRIWPDYTFERYRADTLSASGRLTLERKDDGTIIHYNTDDDGWWTNQWVEFDDRGRLILRDRCVDCYTNVHERIGGG